MKSECSQSEKSQNQTRDQETTHNKKSLRK